MERFFNDYGTTLAGGITNTQATLVVASGSNFPGSGNFRIRIENELLLVTAVSGTTWTVTRGVESSQAVAHLDGMAVNHIVTAGGLAQILAENGGTTTITWMGAWAVGTGYALNDAVSYNGSSYISLQNSNTGNEPDTSPTYWTLLAAASTPTDSSIVVTDNTSNNVSTSAHGFAPKLPNEATKYLDGTGVYSVPTSPQPYDLVASYVGTPTIGATVFILTFTRTVTFAANFSGSYGTVGTNPSSTVGYTVKKNGTTIGTISISPFGLFTFATTGGTSQSVAAGDRLTIIAPNPNDATLADIGITLAGTR